MPMYEFDCRVCGKPFEELVFSLGRVPDVRCPSCGSPDIRKKISSVSARISGGATLSASGGCTSDSL